MTFYTEFETPLCPVVLAGNGDGISHLHLVTGEGRRQFDVDPDWERNDDVFATAVRQIEEYFSGERFEFELLLNPHGTVFQKKVWRELQRILYGESLSYGQVAAAIGNPNAARAVGMASSRNPIPLIVPCHRVVGGSGTLTGFAHGLEAKRWLLDFECQMRLAASADL